MHATSRSSRRCEHRERRPTNSPAVQLVAGRGHQAPPFGSALVGGARPLRPRRRARGVHDHRHWQTRTRSCRRSISAGSAVAAPAGKLAARRNPGRGRVAHHHDLARPRGLQVQVGPVLSRRSGSARLERSATSADSRPGPWSGRRQIGVRHDVTSSTSLKRRLIGTGTRPTSRRRTAPPCSTEFGSLTSDVVDRSRRGGQEGSGDVGRHGPPSPGNVTRSVGGDERLAVVS